MNKSLKLFILIIISLQVSACAGFGMKLKNLMRGNGFVEDASPQKPFSYADNPNYKKGEQRKYSRMTKDQFEREARVGANEGSLWIMEGQSSYLFSQNIVRLVGDLLNVKLEGSGRTQVDSKVTVIKKLLKKIDAPQRKLASDEDGKADDKEKEKDAKDSKDSKDKTADAKDSKDKKDTGKDNSTAKNEDDNNKDENNLGLELVPTRIIQRLPDGNYRIKGTQSFMLGKREYRVVVTGIVREQDFNDDGLSSQAILEPNFDVVSVKRGL
ncbi:MAG: flagellar basal body L-ring protein FlgH [Pseudomonadota bacterium]|nr:flagellar basal body L-ring protein FlgH [Pseudomonadota bacterium]